MNTHVPNFWFKLELQDHLPPFHSVYPLLGFEAALITFLAQKQALLKLIRV